MMQHPLLGTAVMTLTLVTKKANMIVSKLDSSALAASPLATIAF